MNSPEDAGLAACGHPWPCVPSLDDRCDHTYGHGIHQGYDYRCRLVEGHVGYHVHDPRIVGPDTALATLMRPFSGRGL